MTDEPEFLPLEQERLAKYFNRKHPSDTLKVLNEVEQHEQFKPGRWNWSVHDGWLNWENEEGVEISLPISGITYVILKRTDQMCMVGIGSLESFIFAYRPEDLALAKALRQAIFGVVGSPKSEVEALDDILRLGLPESN